MDKCYFNTTFHKGLPAELKCFPWRDFLLKGAVHVNDGFDLSLQIRPDQGSCLNTKPWGKSFWLYHFATEINVPAATTTSLNPKMKLPIECLEIFFCIAALSALQSKQWSYLLNLWAAFFGFCLFFFYIFCSLDE